MITKLNSTKLKVLKENKQDKREPIMGENGEQGLFVAYYTYTLVNY